MEYCSVVNSFDNYIQLRRHGVAAKEYIELQEVLNHFLSQGILKGTIVKDRQINPERNLYHVCCTDTTIDDSTIPLGSQELHAKLSDQHADNSDASISLWHFSEEANCDEVAFSGTPCDTKEPPPASLSQFHLGSGLFQSLASSISSVMFPSR